MHDPKTIRGWGADLDPRRRPGVPMEEKVPHPRPGAQVPIEHQKSDEPVIHAHGGLPRMPPVYGTAVPPKGLSGLLRKVAYEYPDHWVRHWVVLLLADRVDVWEHRLRRGLPATVGVAAVLAIGGLTFKALKR
jgi:hypothetical protein